MEIGRRSSGEFVGRRRELDELQQALAQALGGTGALVLIAGEPGIGKTRLAAEFSREVRMAAVPVRWGRVSPDEAAPPYWPWPEVLAPGLGVTDLTRSLAAVGGVSPDQWQPADRRTRYELFTTVSAALRILSESQGLLIVLDDLQWADEPSLLLLRHVAARLLDARALVLALYRDVEVVGNHAHSVSTPAT
jgi:predicted ATPase